jgi:hypothetical protein
MEIKYDFWKFFVLKISNCFFLFMVYWFWQFRDKYSEILCWIVLFVVVVQSLIALTMISRKRFDETTI